MKITEVKAFALSFKLENAPRRGVGQPIKKDTVISRSIYRAITGACEYGVDQWMKENKIGID